MAYSVKTIKGRKYLYHQRSYRIGKKVKTTSTYIGPLTAAGVAFKLAVKLATGGQNAGTLHEIKQRAVRKSSDR